MSNSIRRHTLRLLRSNQKAYEGRMKRNTSNKTGHKALLLRGGRPSPLRRLLKPLKLPAQLPASISLRQQLARWLKLLIRKWLKLLARLLGLGTPLKP